uniref:serine/threonine protein kinase n=1 Tax=Coprococcus catus TaxID=116085 RepID=UPI001ABEF55E|nr:serine/threonine protein kinase [Coprococcus catus]
MELWIAAGVPSAIVAFCFWMLERRIQERAETEKSERARRQKEQDIKEENREKLQYMMLKALDGSLCLSEATAKAVQRIPDAKCNGDMHKALDYELDAKHDLENFLTRQGVNHITEQYRE